MVITKVFLAFSTQIIGATSIAFLESLNGMKTIQILKVAVGSQKQAIKNITICKCIKAKKHAKNNARYNK